MGSFIRDDASRFAKLSPLGFRVLIRIIQQLYAEKHQNSSS